MRPLNFCRVTNPFAAPGTYASAAEQHGAAGHHTGIDFGSQHEPTFVSVDHQKVHSTRDGVVVISGFNDTMGNWVGVYVEAENVTVTYWHLASRAVDLGDHVSRGSVLGRVDNSGNSEGAHLHVQVNPNRGFFYSAHIDPHKWVRGRSWAEIKAAQRR